MVWGVKEQGRAMASFTDNAGQQWTVEATPDGLRRVREYLGLNLIAMAREPGLVRFSRTVGDIETVINVVYVLVKDRADAIGISDEEFGLRLVRPDPSVIDAAALALAEAITGFVTDRKARKALDKLIDDTRKNLRRRGGKP